MGVADQFVCTYMHARVRVMSDKIRVVHNDANMHGFRCTYVHVHVRYVCMCRKGGERGREGGRDQEKEREEEAERNRKGKEGRKGKQHT